jgi:para-aminobenzoate synthetase component 1
MPDCIFQEISYQEIPDHVFSFLKKLPWAQLLDSGAFLNQNSRYDIMVADPKVTFEVSNGSTQVRHKNGSAITSNQPVFDLIKEHLAGKTETMNELPFNGGAVGYFGYDLFADHGSTSNTPAIDDIPDLAVGIYDWTVITDHQKQKTFFFSQVDNKEQRELLKQIQSSLDEPLTEINHSLSVKKLMTDTDQGSYIKAFQRIQKYLFDGDCYQINFARCFYAAHQVPARSNTPWQDSAWQSYRLLRKNNPVPFGAFLDLPFARILCASPERFLKLKDNEVETRPIKGTRPRGRNAGEDHQLKYSLTNSAKDRAENLMIVDLLRNDLGKSCKTGSIKTPELFSVESFPTVHHLVSTVKGELAEERTAMDLLFHCFPGGSVTGAPKKRAMEIINELEQHKRAIYCGSIGYISYAGNMDTNIAIRTMTVTKEKLSFWAGGAIVTDSEADREFQETQDKARPFFELLKIKKPL